MNNYKHESLLESYFSLVLEENADQEKTDDQKKELKQTEGLKITPDSLVKDAMVLEPAAALKFISQQFGDKSGKEFLSKHLVKFSEYVVKNGWYKAKDLGKSVKDFANKNIEDNSNIDFSEVDIDEDVMKTVYVIDGDCVKSLEKYAEDWKKESNEAIKEAEEASEQLKKDVKKAEVDIDDQKLSDNALIVAGVIDNEENEGKKGEDLDKQIDAKINSSEKLEEVHKKIEDVQKSQSEFDKMRADTESRMKGTKVEEIDVQKLDIDDVKDVKLDQKKSNNENSVADLRNKLNGAIKNKLGKDYKSSLGTGVFKTEEFKKVIEQKIPKIVIDSIKEPYTISTRIDFYNDEAKDVVEAEAGYKVRLLTDNEKNEGLNKIQKTFKDLIKTVVGNDKLLGKKTYAYYKYWNGDNPDGNFDSVFVFVGYAGDQANESLNEEMIFEKAGSLKLSQKVIDKLKKYHEDHFEEFLSDEEKKTWELANMSREAMQDKASKLLDTEGSDAMNKFISDKLDAEQACNKIRMDHSLAYRMVQSGTDGNLKGSIEYNKEFGKVLDLARNDSSIAGDIENAAEDVIDNGTETTAKAIKKAGGTISKVKPQSGAFIGDNPETIDTDFGDTPEVKDAIKDAVENSTEKIENAVEYADGKITGFTGAGQYAKQLGVSQDQLASLFSDFDDPDERRDAINDVNGLLKSFVKKFSSDPDKAVKYLMDNSGNKDQRDALAELACKMMPNAKDAFKNAGITIDGTIDKLGKSAKIAASASKNISSAMRDSFSVSATDGDTDATNKLFQLKNTILVSKTKTKAINELSKAVQAFKDGATEEEVNNAFDKLEEYQKIRDEAWKKISSITKEQIDKMSDGQRKLYALEYKTLCEMDDRLDKYTSKIIQTSDSLDGSNEAAESVAKRIPDAAENGKRVAGLAKSEEAKGFWAKLGGKAAKALHAFGAAVAVAKIAKFCLNHGKNFTDALGSQYVKFKEDKDVIAEIKILLNNGEGSESQKSDTNFGIRFSIDDLKWHATNLDNRKMKIKDEDTLIRRVMETNKAKDFKKRCIDNWSKVFSDKDSAIVYTLKNYKKLGIEINDKGLKKFIPTMVAIADNFEEIKKQFA